MKKLVTVVLISLFLQSCSSIINGRTQKVTITSNVNGAAVVINGRKVGTTPLTTRIKRENSMHITVRKKGYEDHSAALLTRLDGWFFGNIIFGGFLGSTTDLASGSVHLLDPDHIHIQMVEKEKRTSKTKDRMKQDVEFSLIMYKKLIKEIKLGKGPHLRSLYQLKNMGTSDNKKQFLKFLRKETTKHSEPLKFANAVGSF